MWDEQNLPNIYQVNLLWTEDCSHSLCGYFFIYDMFFQIWRKFIVDMSSKTNQKWKKRQFSGKYCVCPPRLFPFSSFEAHKSVLIRGCATGELKAHFWVPGSKVWTPGDQRSTSIHKYQKYPQVLTRMIRHGIFLPLTHLDTNWSPFCKAQQRD